MPMLLISSKECRLVPGSLSFPAASLPPRNVPRGLAPRWHRLGADGEFESQLIGAIVVESSHSRTCSDSSCEAIASLLHRMMKGSAIGASEVLIHTVFVRV